MDILIVFCILLGVLGVFHYFVVRERREQRKDVKAILAEIRAVGVSTSQEKCIDCVWDEDCPYQQKGTEAECS